MTLEGYQHLEIGVIQSYVTDLQNILDESEVAQKNSVRYLLARDRVNQPWHS
jgi:hypothetical protein